MEDQYPSAEGKRPYAAIAKQYARDVVEGSIPACKQVIQACQRHLKDLDRQWDDAEFEFRFAPEPASHACEFIEALPHVKGKWAKEKQRFQLEPWQVFIVANLFGWVFKTDTTRYRFNEAYIKIPRKNGKTFLSAGIALYKFSAEGEYSPEVFFGATSEEQAKRLGFKFAKQIARKSDGLCKAFGVKVNTHNLAKEDGGIMKAVIAKPGDGDSPSCAIVDEYHEHTSAVLHETMKTGMGARENPLLLVITTAGSNRGGPCFLLERDVERILAGTIVNERLFGVIYGIDPGDEPFTEAAAIKANPNYGISIEPNFLLAEMEAARQSARKQNAYKTKHLNIWVNAAIAWIPMEKWNALADPELELEEFKDEECLVGLDLASELDIASKIKLFRRDRTAPKNVAGVELREPHYFLFTKHYLNELAVEEGRGEHYAQWAAEGHLEVTPGNVTDYPTIAAELVEDAKRFVIREVAHDPYHGAALIQFVEKDDEWDSSVEFVKITQNIANLSPAMKLFEKLVHSGRIHHTGDPVMEWMLSNVVCKQISKDNILPDKEQPDRKIDGVSATLAALVRVDVLETGSGLTLDIIEC